MGDLLDNVAENVVRKIVISEAAQNNDLSTEEALERSDTNIVEVPGDVREAVMNLPGSLYTNEIQGVIAAIGTEAARRSGIDHSQIMDATTLQKASETAFLVALEKVQQKINLGATVFNETILRKLAMKSLYLLKTYPIYEESMQVNGKGLDLGDPTDWPQDVIFKTVTGLGQLSTVESKSALGAIMEMQKEAEPMGLSTPLQRYYAQKRFVEASNLGDASEFFVDPDPEKGWQPPEPKPDPQLIQAQNEAAKLKLDDERQKYTLESIRINEEGQAQLALEKEKNAAKQRELDYEYKMEQVRNERISTVLKVLQFNNELNKSSGQDKNETIKLIADLLGDTSGVGSAPTTITQNGAGSLN